MSEYIYKLENQLFPIISDIKNINILELGVQNGRSTKIFLDICKKNSGKLYSVDVDDCSKVSNDKNWTFIHTRDDDFEKIKNIAPKELDVIFIDTLHEAAHVEKILYGYYNNLKAGGYIFIDDISHLPYLKNMDRDNFYCEINNKETFNKILEIYNVNKKNFDLNFSFAASGLAILKKKNEDFLQRSKKIKTREHSIKSILRRLIKF